MAWIFVLIAAGARLSSTSPATISALRGAFFGIGALVLVIMWLIFIVRIMLGLP